MPVLRANALRSLNTSLRSSNTARATLRAAAPARTQLVARRYASSGGHGGHGEASSDLPWMLAAIGITPPACWYLWPDTSHAEHHGEHGEDEEHAEGEEKPSDEDQSSEEGATQEASAPAEQDEESEKGSDGDAQSEEKSDDSKDTSDDQEQSDDSKDTSDDQEQSKESEESAKPSGSEGEAQGNPAKSKSEGATEQKPGSAEKEGVEGVQFKGKMKEDSAGHADERKSQPSPSKDSRVKRIDSGLGKKLGEGDTYDEDDPKKESQATSKPEGSNQGDITQKQKGLSTTDTKHSIPIDQHSDKSKKGSGEPETAKAKGTVDPKSPVR